MAELAGTGLHPAWLCNLVTLPTELGGFAMAILNGMTWLGAGALGIFTVFATFLGHRFWEFGGAKRATKLNSFLEHVRISTAFILVTVIAVRDERLDRP